MVLFFLALFSLIPPSDSRICKYTFPDEDTINQPMLNYFVFEDNMYSVPSGDTARWVKGQILFPGNALLSPKGVDGVHYAAILEYTGRFQVIGITQWMEHCTIKEFQTKTIMFGGGSVNDVFLYFQGEATSGNDGNLVLYEGTYDIAFGALGTSGTPNASKSVWSFLTSCPTSSLCQTYTAGIFSKTHNAAFGEIIMQSDGNLVAFCGATSIWSSDSDAEQCRMTTPKLPESAEASESSVITKDVHAIKHGNDGYNVVFVWMMLIN